MAKRVVGLDIRSVCVGFAIFEGDTLKRYGKYRQKGAEHGEKLGAFQAWLESLLESENPDELIFEAPFPGRRRNAFGVLMMYIAVVLLTYYRWAGQELPAENRVRARDVKTCLRVKHGKTHAARKRLMVLEINRRYSLNLKFKDNDKTKRVSDDDVADAIAVVHTWLARNGR